MRIIDMRMTWDQIKNEYQDQNVCLTDIEWEDRPQGNIRSAEVVASEKDTPYEEMLIMAGKSSGQILCIDTCDDILCTVGTMVLCG